MAISSFFSRHVDADGARFALRIAVGALLSSIPVYIDPVRFRGCCVAPLLVLVVCVLSAPHRMYFGSVVKVTAATLCDVLFIALPLCLTGALLFHAALRVFAFPLSDGSPLLLYNLAVVCAVFGLLFLAVATVPLSYLRLHPFLKSGAAISLIIVGEVLISTILSELARLESALEEGVYVSPQPIIPLIALVVLPPLLFTLLGCCVSLIITFWLFPRYSLRNVPKLTAKAMALNASSLSRVSTLIVGGNRHSSSDERAQLFGEADRLLEEDEEAEIVQSGGDLATLREKRSQQQRELAANLRREAVTVGMQELSQPVLPSKGGGGDMAIEEGEDVDVENEDSHNLVSDGAPTDGEVDAEDPVDSFLFLSSLRGGIGMEGFQTAQSILSLLARAKALAAEMIYENILFPVRPPLLLRKVRYQPDQAWSKVITALEALTIRISKLQSAIAEVPVEVPPSLSPSPSPSLSPSYTPSPPSSPSNSPISSPRQHRRAVRGRERERNDSGKDNGSHALFTRAESLFSSMTVQKWWGCTVPQWSALLSSTVALLLAMQPRLFGKRKRSARASAASGDVLDEELPHPHALEIAELLSVHNRLRDAFLHTFVHNLRSLKHHSDRTPFIEINAIFFVSTYIRRVLEALRELENALAALERTRDRQSGFLHWREMACVLQSVTFEPILFFARGIKNAVGGVVVPLVGAVVKAKPRSSTSSSTSDEIEEDLSSDLITRSDSSNSNQLNTLMEEALKEAACSDNTLEEWERRYKGRSPWRYVLKHFVAIFIGVLLVITLVLLTIKEPVEREAPPTDEGEVESSPAPAPPPSGKSLLSASAVMDLQPFWVIVTVIIVFNRTVDATLFKVTLRFLATVLASISGYFVLQTCSITGTGTLSVLVLLSWIVLCTFCCIYLARGPLQYGPILFLVTQMIIVSCQYADISDAASGCRSSFIYAVLRCVSVLLGGLIATAVVALLFPALGVREAKRRLGLLVTSTGKALNDLMLLYIHTEKEDASRSLSEKKQYMRDLDDSEDKENEGESVEPVPFLRQKSQIVREKHENFGYLAGQVEISRQTDNPRGFDLMVAEQERSLLNSRVEALWKNGKKQEAIIQALLAVESVGWRHGPLSISRLLRGCFFAARMFLSDVRLLHIILQREPVLTGSYTGSMYQPYLLPASSQFAAVITHVVTLCTVISKRLNSAGKVWHLEHWKAACKRCIQATRGSAEEKHASVNRTDSSSTSYSLKDRAGRAEEEVEALAGFQHARMELRVEISHRRNMHLTHLISTRTRMEAQHRGWTSRHPTTRDGGKDESPMMGDEDNQQNEEGTTERDDCLYPESEQWEVFMADDVVRFYSALHTLTVSLDALETLAFVAFGMDM